MSKEHDEQDKVFCEFATKNPSCPYIVTIKLQGKDVQIIKTQVQQILTILGGENMQGGLISKIHTLWMSYKILTGLAAISITAIAAVVVDILLRGMA